VRQKTVYLIQKSYIVKLNILRPGFVSMSVKSFYCFGEKYFGHYTEAS